MEQTRRDVRRSQKGAIEIWEGVQSLQIFLSSLSSLSCPSYFPRFDSMQNRSRRGGEREAVWLGFLQTFLG